MRDINRILLTRRRWSFLYMFTHGEDASHSGLKFATGELRWRNVSRTKRGELKPRIVLTKASDRRFLKLNEIDSRKQTEWHTSPGDSGMVRTFIRIHPNHFRGPIVRLPRYPLPANGIHPLSLSPASFFPFPRLPRTQFTCLFTNAILSLRLSGLIIQLACQTERRLWMGETIRRNLKINRYQARAELSVEINRKLHKGKRARDLTPGNSVTVRTRVSLGRITASVLLRAVFMIGKGLHSNY